MNEGFGIGDLRRRVTLFSPERTPDGAGGFTRSWVEAGEYWARVAPLASGESAAADRLESPPRFRAEMRAPNPAQAGWRVFWRQRWHRIEVVQSGERPGDLIQFVIVEISE